MSKEQRYIYEGGAKFPIKHWTRDVHIDPNAMQQLRNVANMPFIHKHVAVMPDVHYGIGATVGSVIPTHSAIIPAAVGVDIGCGMMAVMTTLTAADLPDSLRHIRDQIERAVPHGMVSISGRSKKGAFEVLPNAICSQWAKLNDRYDAIVAKHPKISKKNPHLQLGTLGGGNHFIEICLDEQDRVWVMLHSGSRGVGNLIGRYFMDVAKEDMRVHHINLPEKDLSYLSEGTKHFDEYIEALDWAQEYARENREAMMRMVLMVLRENLKPFQTVKEAINCHHNYAQKENHFGANVWITRKGAVSAREGELGIIPGSMGAKSFIVRGLGNADSFCSCSHGAGRVMSRTEAKAKVSMEQHLKDMGNIEAKAVKSILDETPRAYKNIDDVMSSQDDLVEIMHTLRQVVCVKG